MDRGASGDATPPRSSFTRPASRWGRNLRRQIDRELRSRTPCSTQSELRRDAITEVPEVTISDGREDKEEQLRPRQRRRTTPHNPSPSTEAAILVSPSPTSSRDVPMERERSEEVKGKVLALASEATADVPLEILGPSWLQPGFKMPREEEGLGSLAAKIEEATPPLCNIWFTNHYATSYIGGTILSQAANIESLEAMGEMRVDEATNRVGVLISLVSSCLLLTKQFALCIRFNFLLSCRFLPMCFTFPTPELLWSSSGLQKTKSGGPSMNLVWRLWRVKLPDNFKSSAKYNAEMGREVGSYLDNGCIHIICQLHPYFEDKSILLKEFETSFDNEVWR